MTDESTRGTAAADSDRIAAWFRGRLPEGWIANQVVVDRDEITVVIDLPTTGGDGDSGVAAVGVADIGTPAGGGADSGTAGGTTETPQAAATSQDVVAEELAGRISRFREDTRADRVAIAREAERRYERKVAWGVSDGTSTQLFTTIAVPVMTRLRQPERKVLDTLVESGVARSRAHALAWCVDLVGQHSAEWLGELRHAMTEVERVRAAGPVSRAG